MTDYILPRINFTGDIIFEHSAEIRLSDINVGQHLSNDKALDFITDNHAKFYIKHGCIIGDIHGLAEIFVATYIRYKKEVKYSNSITIGLGIYKKTCSRIYFYHVIKNDQEEICHEGIIETVYIDLKTGKVSELSSKLLLIIGEGM